MKTALSLKEIKNENPAIKAFLFDLDGTLVDSEEGIIHTVMNVLQSKGYNIDKDEIKSRFGTPLEKLIPMLIPVKSTERIWFLLNEIRDSYTKNHLEITTAFDGAVELLKELKDERYHLGIASTKYKKFVVEQAEHFGFTKYVKVIVSGYEVENHKPAPDILFMAANLLQVKPEECVYIGDAPTDVIAGKAAGMLTIAVLSGPQNSKEIEKTQPHFIIPNLTAIKI